MNYADKYDAQGEALHEIFAGNQVFVTNVVNEFGTIPTPTEYYAGFFDRFTDKFPRMQPLLTSSLPFFAPVPDRTEYYRHVAQTARPHTATGLTRPTGEHHYDIWRQVVVAAANPEVLRDLSVPKEPR